ncbi:MAG TPA: hypothetical protein VGJ84_03620, partial [Polyangiaceae bacterium]
MGVRRPPSRSAVMALEARARSQFEVLGSLAGGAINTLKPPATARFGAWLHRRQGKPKGFVGRA